MPDLTPLTIPQDALAKVEEKVKSGVDYYADLTDEERAEEGLPPREEARPEEKQPEPAKKDEPAGDPENDEPTSDEAIGKLFEEIATLREDIGAALGKPEPAAAKKDEDPLMQAALDHEDETIRGLAERLQQAEERLAQRESEARDERINRQVAKDDAEFDAVQKDYQIGGKPMTDRQVEAVEDYILKHPEVGRALSIEQVTRVVFPDAVKVARRAPPAKSPGAAANGDGSTVATIVDTGASGGGSPTEWKPRPNETIESAIQEAGKRFGWKR